MSHFTPLALLLVALADGPAPASPSPVEVASALETALSDAIARAEPSVVAIARERSGEADKTTAVQGQARPRAAVERRDLRGNFGVIRGDEDLVATDFGSGVVLAESGQILTAFHVVQGASRLVVRASGKQTFDAVIIAADPRTDLAVIVPHLAPDEAPPRLTPIKLGDASKLRKGAFLVALGNPFNAARDGTASASWGILSNTARRLDPTPDELQLEQRQLRHYPTLLQLDSKLNLGMSGGAVVNLKGELVGLTTATVDAAAFDAQAGYAIPIDPLTRRSIDALRQGKEAEYGFIGIRLNNQVSNQVEEVSIGSPADNGGLIHGDTIVGVGDRSVADGDDLILAVNAAPVGEPVRLRVRRGNTVIDKTVVLSKLGVVGEVIATNRPAPWRGVRVDYTSAAPGGGPHDQRILDSMAKGTVVVAEVVPGSPAEAAGLQRGLYVLKVDGQAVRTPKEFAQAVAGRKGPVTLTTDLGTITVK